MKRNAHADRERTGRMPSTQTPPTNARRASGQAGEQAWTGNRMGKRVDGWESAQATAHTSTASAMGEHSLDAGTADKRVHRGVRAGTQAGHDTYSENEGECSASMQGKVST
ncbi:uncharacterized protein B0H18DRAFT_1118613 [Fomitopsis serialis]|uniref:uncharacterized protein n=1 Tax=Fomitopsis serialis TaxID=139415 RepID=UPI0020072AA6|nr:uncharacterized protein B0H18DRAFT_1118613 [Neoantrodia serialis]KAH9927357.1 hypothetical protein B0H18DRAFT_1118613 [Neoantrodia serialis]